jgi:beta-carotene hydroxylase
MPKNFAKNESSTRSEIKLPRFADISEGLTRITWLQLVGSLILPFVCIALYFVFALFQWWILAVICLFILSFVTYGSVSHDLVHANLGLNRRLNELMLSLIELLALRSGHAYRLAHLHHHARFPHHDDVEGSAAGMPMFSALLEGVTFQPRIWLWALKNAKNDQLVIFLEGLGCLAITLLSILILPWTFTLFVYVVLLIVGSWPIPLITSYIPHVREGNDALHQTRRFRGKMASLIAAEHLYHLEHHLYPAVPHHHWPELAKRLDPFLDAAGVKPVKFWF